METSLIDGILIGGAGGSIAGLTLYFVQHFHNKWKDYSDKEIIFIWLSKNSTPEEGKAFRSTRAIASFNNLTEDRVRYICSHHEKIFLSIGPKDDLWSIHSREDLQRYGII